MVSKLRARSQDDKLVRREHLLKSARSLWYETDLEGFSMAGVARRAGLVKGTVYLYFQTKEALMLAVLTRELEDWFDKLDTKLEHERDWSAGIVARVIAENLRERGALMRLLTVQSSILERNVSLETALAFKGFLLDRATRSGLLLEQVLPWLAPGEGVLVLQRVNALIIGFAQLADPSPIVREVLERPAFAPLRVKFDAQFQLTLEAVLIGLEHRRS